MIKAVTQRVTYSVETAFYSDTMPMSI